MLQSKWSSRMGLEQLKKLQLICTSLFSTPWFFELVVQSKDFSSTPKGLINPVTRAWCYEDGFCIFVLIKVWERKNLGRLPYVTDSEVKSMTLLSNARSTQVMMLHRVGFMIMYNIVSVVMYPQSNWQAVFTLSSESTRLNVFIELRGCDGISNMTFKLIDHLVELVVMVSATWPSSWSII